MPKVGDIRYTFMFCEGKGYFSEWHLRTIRGGYVYFIRKDKYTWVKKSKKHFDYGWAKNISHYDREKIKITKPMKYGLLRPTKFGAVVQALLAEEDYYNKGWLDESEIKDLEGLRRYIKRNATRLRKMK